MELRVIDKSKNGMKLEVVGETHTLLNLLRESAWKNGAKQASYVIEHPYMSEPKLIVKSAQAKSVLSKSSDQVASDAASFKRAFDAALKK